MAKSARPSDHLDEQMAALKEAIESCRPTVNIAAEDDDGVSLIGCLKGIVQAIDGLSYAIREVAEEGRRIAKAIEMQS